MEGSTALAIRKSAFRGRTAVFSRDFADDGEHPLAEANVYYTRLAEPIEKMWATNPRSPQGNTQVIHVLLRGRTAVIHVS